MKKLIFRAFLPIILMSTFFGLPVQAQEIENTEQEQLETKKLDEGEVAQILAPIALYPDSLLTHILIASTYPIEVIEAHRWVEKNPDVEGEAVEKKVEPFNWDPSIVALVAFPTVLEKMNTELSWTQQLGDAFLQDEEQVLATIQTLRAKAQQAGNLDKMENVQVIKEKETIIIQPAEKEVVYVPYYDTRVVYGGWYWGYYPPVYWHYPHYHVVHHRGPFYWHSGVHIRVNFYYSSVHWHTRHVVISRGYPRPHPYKPHYGYKKSVSHGGYANATRWSHSPKHRRGVAYKNTSVSKKYHSSRPSRYDTKSVRNYEKQLASRQNVAKTNNSMTRHQKLNQKVSTSSTKNVKHAVPKSSKTMPTNTNNHSVKAKTNNSPNYRSEPKKANDRSSQQVKSPKPTNRATPKQNTRPENSQPSNKNYSKNQTKRHASTNGQKQSPSRSQHSSKGGSRRNQ